MNLLLLWLSFLSFQYFLQFSLDAVWQEVLVVELLQLNIFDVIFVYDISVNKFLLLFTAELILKFLNRDWFVILSELLVSFQFLNFIDHAGLTFILSRHWIQARLGSWSWSFQMTAGLDRLVLTIVLKPGEKRWIHLFLTNFFQKLAAIIKIWIFVDLAVADVIVAGHAPLFLFKFGHLIEAWVDNFGIISWSLTMLHVQNTIRIRAIFFVDALPFFNAWVDGR